MSKSTEHKVVRVLYVTCLGAIALYLVSPFIAPIILAGTVALALHPLQLRIEEKGMHRKKASFLLASVFGVLISIPFFFFVVKGTLAVTEQLERFSRDSRFKDKGVSTIIDTLKNDVVLKVQGFAEQFGIRPFFTEEKLDLYLVKANGILLGFFQKVATNLPTIFLFFLVMVCCTYSFLKNAEAIRSFFQKGLGFSDRKMEIFVRQLIQGSRSVYVSNIATGSMQSTIVATAVSLLGLGDFFLVFFITLILAFIPVIGAAPVAFFFSLLAFLRGDSTTAIIMVVVGSFTGVADNFLRPYLTTIGKSKLPTLAAFVFVVGGALILGFPGLFIGLLVGCFAWDTLPIFWEELGKGESAMPVSYVREPHREGPPDLGTRH